MKTTTEKKDKSLAMLVPFLAAVLGSSPATYVSFEMFNGLSKQTAINDTKLIYRGVWMQRTAAINEAQDRAISAHDSRLARLEALNESREFSR